MNINGRVVLVLFACTLGLWSCAEFQDAINGPKKPAANSDRCTPGQIDGEWFTCPEKELEKRERYKAQAIQVAEDDTKALITAVEEINRWADAILATPYKGDRELQKALGVARRAKEWAQGMLARFQSPENKKYPFGSMSDKRDAREGIREYGESIKDAGRTLANGSRIMASPMRRSISSDDSWKATSSNRPCTFAHSLRSVVLRRPAYCSKA